MSLTPILREKLRGLKAEEEEKMRIMKERQRLDQVEQWVRQFYIDAINYAKINTNTTYIYMLPPKASGHNFQRDNMIDILTGLRDLFPDCFIKNTTLSRGQDGNSAEYYYQLFPGLYPYYLPDDHYKVNYDETKYPINRDYRTFKSAPAEIKSSHRVEWEDGYGPCNVCALCIDAKKRNEEQNADYYKRLKAWRENGTPM